MLQSQRLRLVEVTDVPHNMLLLDFLFSHKEGKKRRREKKTKQWNKTNNKTRIWLMKKNKIRKKKKKVLTFAKIPQRMSQANKIWSQPTQDDRYLGQPVFPSTLRGGKKKKHQTYTSRSEKWCKSNIPEFLGIQKFVSWTKALLSS